MRNRMSLDRMEELGIGQLWLARKQNGHTMSCYICIDGKVHNFDDRRKTYDPDTVHFIEPIKIYNGPDPKTLRK